MTAGQEKNYAMKTDQPTLHQFIASRLGPGSSPGQLLRVMLARAFGAGSFDEFWRYWNPVYGYYLYYRCYRPLRRLLPRPLSVLLTFAASGFLLHDLPFGWWVRALRFFQTGRFPVPFVTLWFSSMGGATLLSRALRLNLADRPFAIRVTLNAAWIVLTLLLALGITRLIG